MATPEEGTTAAGGAGVAGAVRHFFHLRDLLHRWQWPISGKPVDPTELTASTTSFSFSSSAGAAPGSPSTPPSRALNSCPSCDLAQEGLIPPDVPEGCLAVYVGEEHRRFVIPAAYLAEPAFGAMLEKAAEEFGFEFTGAIQLPCEVEAFKYILQCMEVRHQTQHRLSHCSVVDCSKEGDLGTPSGPVSADASAAAAGCADVELTSGPVVDLEDDVVVDEHAGGRDLMPSPTRSSQSY